MTNWEDRFGKTLLQGMVPSKRPVLLKAQAAGVWRTQTSGRTGMGPSGGSETKAQERLRDLNWDLNLLVHVG